MKPETSPEFVKNFIKDPMLKCLYASKASTFVRLDNILYYQGDWCPLLIYTGFNEWRLNMQAPARVRSYIEEMLHLHRPHDRVDTFLWSEIDSNYDPCSRRDAVMINNRICKSRV